MFAGAKIGAGVSVSSVVQNFGAGNVEGTGRALDLAISGEGFFKLSQEGQVVYSRNGQLTLTPDGYLENAQGARLMSNAGVLQVPSAAMPASATTKLSSVFNLKSSDAAKPATPAFDPADSDTFNYASTASVYDSLGNVHQVTTYFRRVEPAADRKWEMYATLDGKPVAGTPPALTPTSTITFDENGVLDTAYTPDKVLVTAADLDNGAADLEFEVNLIGTTQFGNDYDQSSLTQDGYTAGSLVGITIDQNGTIVGNYSNEQKQTVGSLILATFRTPEGLQSVGNNVWIETAASGQPLFGTAGVGRFGSVESGALEVSNVDMTKELVNLIVAQRTFQANAQSVKAQSDMLEQAVNLR